MATQPDTGGNTATPDIALYIHIPFCQSRCPYCDFNTCSGAEALIPSYVQALVRELHQWGALLDSPGVRTIFFGGGTPSYIPGQHIAAVLETVRRAFRVAPDAEITLEANPGDLSGEHLRSLHETGVNRLSMGVQSLDDSLLELLGRRHSAQEALEAYHRARRAGFTNVSMDLMYGIPHQGMKTWRSTLDRAIALSPEHLSLYCLTLEDDTPMEQQVSRGEVPQPDPDLAADMYLAAEKLLERAGYRHYEISNWARAGRESHHNLTYWHNQPYLGIGAGAHSYLGKWRFHDVLSPLDYVQRLGTPALPPASDSTVSQEALARMLAVEEVEAIDRRLEMAETMMLGLRLDEGVSLESFAARFGEGVSSMYGEQVRELTDLGLVKLMGETLRLTRRGRLLGNEVFLRFFGG